MQIFTVPNMYLEIPTLEPTPLDIKQTSKPTSGPPFQSPEKSGPTVPPAQPSPRMAPTTRLPTNTQPSPIMNSTANLRLDSASASGGVPMMSRAEPPFRSMLISQSLAFSSCFLL